MKKLVLGAIVILFTMTAFAQTKVGTINRDFILSKMPELTGAQEAVKEYNLDLENQLKQKLDNYDKIVKTAEAAIATMTDAEKQAKQQELAGLENDITKFRNNGVQLVQLKQNEVLLPLYKKIDEAMNEVATSENYTQILSTSNSNTILFASEAYDITQKVMKKLAIKID